MTKKILIMVSVVMLIALVGCSQKTVKVVIIYGLQKKLPQADMLWHTNAGLSMNTYMHVTNNMQQTVTSAMGNRDYLEQYEKVAWWYLIDTQI